MSDFVGSFNLHFFGDESLYSEVYDKLFLDVTFRHCAAMVNYMCPNGVKIKSIR